MKIILIDECYPLNTRNTRILDSLEKAFPQGEVHVLTWDRSCAFDGGRDNWHYHLYDKKAQYGNKWQKLTGLFGYKKYCKSVINQLQPDVIIASHWNNLLMLPSVDYKRQMIIYENLDAPTGPWIGRKILNWIERYYMKRIALTVHASRFYTEIYSPKYPQLVLENKPTQSTNVVDYHPDEVLKVVYLGNIRYIEILKNLVDAVRNHPNIQLKFHGGGPDYDTLCSYTAEIPNVECTGAYRYEDIAVFYNAADVIWAAYPNKDFNVKYAISNKFHESLAFCVPAIYADKTMLGQYASQHMLGFETNPYSTKSIEESLLMLSKDKTLLAKTHDAIKLQHEKESLWQQDVESLVKKVNEFFHA